MSQWGWTIAAVIAVITLVQIVVFYYFIRNDRGGSLWPFSGSESRAGTPGQVGAPDGDHDRDRGHEERFDTGDPLHGDEGLTKCSECGTPNRNDSMFTFCRNCGSEL